MFEQLFTRPQALARHRAGPLSKERAQFLAHLTEHGVPHRALQGAASALLRVANTLTLAHRSGESMSRDDIKREVPGKPYRLMAIRWLQFLGQLKREPIPTNPYSEKIEAFADYMQHERGLSDSTIRNRAKFLRQFLGHLGVPNGSLREITITRIDDALVEMVNQGGYARASVQTGANMLRAFLRYAELRGWCRKGLAEAIKSPPNFTQVSLPVGPSWDDVRRLLAMTEGNRPVDIRDRAILMLLAIYALRTGEVGRLRLGDFDWERELLSVVCPKTRRTRTFPLIRPVGDAVIRYLKEVRPRSVHREVFLTPFRPIRPLRTALWGIVGVRLRRLGVSIPHYGPHALRHSCASHLLAQGMSLKEIGDHLGHQKPDTTRIYAKVDLVGLRQVADFDLGGLR
jgi:integrase/recombinase XerD